MQDEIASPLDADHQLGARESDWHRIAEIIPPPPIDLNAVLGSLDPESVPIKTLAVSIDSSSAANSPEYRHAQIGATNGHSNARALGRILSPLVADGEQRLLSQKTIDRMVELQYKGIDAVTLVPICWGIGYGLSHPDTTPYIPQGRVIFWAGWAGSILLVDFDRNLVISYVMNKMAEGVVGSERTRQYVETIYKAVEQTL